MSQKPASSAPSSTRVASGVPWWLWGILILLGGSIAASMILQSIPEDPEKIYEQAMTGIKILDKETVEVNLAKLRAFPEYRNKCQVIDGIMELSQARPLKAIKTLQGVVDDEEVRPLALRTLGNAYAQADQRWKAIEIFESLVKEDPKSDEARYNLALLYYQVFAWDEALKHFDVLVENKFLTENILQMKSEIYAELGESDKAIDALAESIKANPNDPANGTKAATLMRLLVKSGQLDRATDFLQYVDQSMIRNLIEAEKLLKKGDPSTARTMVMEMRKESPLGLVPNYALSKVMLAFGTKEKAVEGLSLLRISLQGQRDLELYQNVLALARLAEEEPYAALVQQNVDQLVELNRKFSEKLQEVVRTVNAPELRIELFQLARETGRLELAMKIVDGLMSYYPERLDEMMALKKQLFEGLPQLVNTMTTEDLEKAAAAAVEARGATPGSPFGGSAQPAAVGTESGASPPPSSPQSTTPETPSTGADVPK